MQSSSHPAALLIDQLDLWKHQSYAVAKMRQYISKYIKGFPEDKTDRAALVHMPTGTGKTRVIASLALYAPEAKSVLILAPRIALRDQLLKKLKEGFFKRRVSKGQSLPKQVLPLRKQDVTDNKRKMNKTVLIGTIQKLDRMFATDQSSSKRLLDHVSLVIVDEGHYEPAVSWSETIRRFEVPRILFTATPFRNDYKPFAVDDEYTYSFSFQKAVAQSYVRDVVFEQRPAPDTPNKFVQDIVSFYNRRVLTEDPEARVIIRCDSEDSIRSIAKALRTEKQDYVAIHENFVKNIAAGEYKSVPDPEKTPATFWIHQFKLLEGIDDERFRLVAMFDRLENTRQLIQQIGRVVRNTNRVKGAKAYVLDHHLGWHEAKWNRFRNWDYAVKPEIQMVSLGKRLEAIRKEHQPAVEYVDGDFRARLDFDTVDISKELQLPRAVNLLQKERGFKMDSFCRHLEYRFVQDDRVYKLYERSRGTVVYMYLGYENSPFLRESYFLQLSHRVMVIRDLGPCLAFYDSSDFVPMNTPEAGVGRALDSRFLRGVFPKPTSNSGPKNSFLIMVSMRNSHLGGRAVRSRSFWAADVQETIPSLDDHAQIIKSVFGYGPVDGESSSDTTTGEWRARRYVGFNRGRISQAGEYCSLGEYLSWLDTIEDLVKGGQSPIPAFERFAATETRVTDRTAKNILLDLYEVQDNYLTVADPDRGIVADSEMEIEDLCQFVEDGRFNVTVCASGKTFECPLVISYDDKRRKYDLDSETVEPNDLTRVQLENVYRPRAGLPRESVIGYLNRTQSFRVLPASPNVIYVHGEFYRPVIKTGREFDRETFQVGKILQRAERLHSGGVRKGFEKGTRCLSSGEGWEAGSLFDLIDKLGAGDKILSVEFGKPDILVCDDMETEMADFILADHQRSLVVFIHAKASDKPRSYSASAITEVCGQALKNIHYLSMFNQEKPTASLEKWKREWKAPPKVVGTVKNRIRRPRGGNPVAVWKEIESIIRDPLARREVWLFLGQVLSKSALEKELAKATDEAVQAAILLHGTMASIASIDAKMRVFCCK